MSILKMPSLNNDSLIYFSSDLKDLVSNQRNLSSLQHAESKFLIYSDFRKIKLRSAQYFRYATTPISLALFGGKEVPKNLTLRGV
jgi:hypothetical protein